MCDDAGQADDLEGAFGKQRRNVVVVAAALFVYYVAAGKLETLSLPVVGLKLNKPGRIEWLLWAVLIYSTWRYALYGSNLWGAVKMAVRSMFYGSPKVQALVDRYFRRDHREHYETFTEMLKGAHLGVNTWDFNARAGVCGAVSTGVGWRLKGLPPINPPNLPAALGSTAKSECRR